MRPETDLKREVVVEGSNCGLNEALSKIDLVGSEMLTLWGVVDHCPVGQHVRMRNLTKLSSGSIFLADSKLTLHTGVQSFLS